MTARQRFLEALTFGKPDRVPLEPGWPRESTLAAWHRQGLAPDRHFYSALLEELGIEPEVTKPQVGLGISFRMIPEFEEKVLEHRDGHYVVQDWMGAIVEIADCYDHSYLRSAKDFVTRKWHRFPVETRADWGRMRERYDPSSPGRFPNDFDERCQALGDRDCVASISFNGPFWQVREWCGFEGLCTLMADDPGFVEEMCGFWSDFVSQMLAPVLGRVQLDHVFISEDMAFKAHSMISPAMVRRFLMPAYRKWVPQIKASGCPIVDMDSDGYVADLIPLWIEAGINCCWPVEVAAGNDIVEYRRRYGRQMAFHGGIDKRAIAKGGEVMRAEVMRVVPPLLEEGGFIPGCDHGVPPDISWPNFVEYARLLAELTGWL
jgi:uroporphyrinogen decarboxylase